MKRTFATACAATVLVASVAVSASATQAAPPSRSSSPTALAAQAIAAHPADIRATGSDAYAIYSVHSDADGASHVRYTRTYQGLRVHGGDFVVHSNADGSYDGASVGLVNALSLSTTAEVTAAQAARTARAAFAGTVGTVESPEKFVDASTGTGRLAWETVVKGRRPDGQTPSVLHVITDATSGAVLGSFDEVMEVNGTGNSLYSGTVTIDTTFGSGIYSMIDPSHGNGRTCDAGLPGCPVFTDADNVWGNGTNADRASAGVDAHFGAAATFDYFKNVHNRNGIFGNGAGVTSRVHYGTNYVNAFWDGTQMTYGDGLGRPLVSLDVAGHEMSHGVTENVVPGGLTYSGESGGLNEATSDIFGSMVEFYAAAPADPGDYLIGEKIDINGNGTPLRYMYNPTLDGSSHGCWSTSTKSIDVHYSSGVANHFYFNLAEGSGATPYGTSPLCGSAAAVTGIGRAKAERIWFRALDVYFTSNTSYVNTAAPANTSRAYTLAAAADLFGLCGTEYVAVQKAWTSVNVPGADAACPGGPDFVLGASPTSGSVNPGSALTTTISATQSGSTAQTVALAAAGLPSGATAAFSPTSISSNGGTSTLTIATSVSTPPGTYQVTVTGTGTSSTRTTTFTLTVNGPAGCSQTNATDIAIPDLSTVESPVVISGCPGNASATSTVTVNILHTYIGDLVVSLIAPDGTASILHNRTGGATDNINQTYPVNLSGKAANGTWKLRVQDAASADVGTIDSWTINLVGSTPVCAGTNPADVPIPDNTTVNSTIVLSGCPGNASPTSTVTVEIVHTYIGDLVVTLVAPDGSLYVLHNRTGGATDNINQSYTLNLSPELRNGTWTLRVQDAATSDTGYINSWALTTL
ncbi:Zn-dependent metalloprotease/subtilisin-like proprotein convertase family protein [Allocatelliglobosispora scoriae]|uniref:Zn-dependent metalloprotease/subtilisin-like proprotein convertase family protein n=1 Tax=Allocatelliglobosispora scoriae TaxID=643052 RepID=A0A841C5U7_9ACTN|nr:proprotein convertase P-domain-containing protein [Allocatelliglobosispora scoriae]MBB5874669.1 Zn-dependent metalloprotease/subtilisin-like proprotein convertase family protein [Allocatelliglobosispora scoriae]